MDTDPRAVELAADQANEWLERLKNPGSGDNAAFMQWLRTSPLHVRELLLAAALEAGLRGVDPNGAIDVQKLLDLAGTVTAAPVGGASVQRQSSEVTSRTTGVGLTVLKPMWRVAAGIAVISLAVFATFTLSRAYSERLITTEASEWRTKLLPDGTQVKVGPRSTLHVDISKRERHVYVSRGEVLFTVAYDAKRPFIVHTRRAEVRAVGTVFGVTDLDGRVLVTVEEGTVAVRRSSRVVTNSGRAVDTEVRVVAGQQVAVTEAQALVVTAVDPSVALAWAQGRLIVSGWTIEEAAKEFNRRNLTQIEITDPQLAAARIFGVFEADDPQSFAATVRHSYGHRVEIADRHGRIRLGLLPDTEQQAPRSQ